MMPGTPFHRRVRTDLHTYAIGQREERIAGKTGAAKEHADLRKRQLCPVQSDPHGIPNDSEPAVPVTSGTVRRQAAYSGALRQKVAPERAVLRQVLLGDPPAGAFVFHVGL